MPALESTSDQKYQHQLPTVVFRVVDDKALTVPAGVSSEQSRSYGYNDGSDFERPEHYIRFIEPIESELKVQVEYDMDEQDQAWLDIINAERAKESSGSISYETFEILIDKLEKEWFELIKRIPQPASHMPVEDSKCAICDDGEGENSNAIVFCDGCNLAVHQDCYGVPYIPEGQWLCRKCTVSPENPVSCLFCPNEGGAFKQTSTGHWSHLLCAIWIPEVGVGNAIYMEPVEGADAIPRNRWKLVCSLCRERSGACIQCDNRNCFTAFHVTCARQMGLLGSMKVIDSDQTLRAYCPKHLPAEARAALDMDDDLDSSYSGTPMAPRIMPNARGAVTTKSARAHAKSYRPGPPIVPHMIVESLLKYTMKINIRKREQFVERLCRYWSLKREARRGAPLLKRLHLEPWTASSASKQQTEAEKAQKLKFLTKLRNDLDKVRMLAELVRKREKEKLRQMQVIKDVADSFFFPHDPKLRLVLERIAAMDKNSLFLHPVSKLEVPDYFDVIKEPMCWSFIDDKLEKNAYKRVEDFTRDISLVLDNAMLYNKPDTAFNRIAKRIKTNAQPLLDELAGITSQAKWTTPESDDVPDQAHVGDLEPSLLLLQTLIGPEEAGADRDHLDNIFAYELEKPREPTPPPPVKKTDAQRRAERKERHEREREERARKLATGAGLAMRATRGTKALEDAFRKEAGVANSSDVEMGGNRRSRRGEPELDDEAEEKPVPGDETPKEETEEEKAKRIKKQEQRQRERERKREKLEKKRAQRARDNERREIRKQERKAERERLEAETARNGNGSGNGNAETSTSSAESRAVAVLGTPEVQEEVERDTSARASTMDRSSPDKGRRSRSQVGVVGIETYNYISDKERRKRERALDLVTEEVGSQDQFKRFNVGWVLAEGSKRKRTQTSADPPKSIPGPKRQKSEPKSVPPVSAGAASSRMTESARTLTPVRESGSSLTGISSSPLSSENGDVAEVEPRSAQKKKNATKTRGSDSWLTQTRARNGKFLSKAQKEEMRRDAGETGEAEEADAGEDDDDGGKEDGPGDASDGTDATEKVDDDDDDEMTSIQLTSPVRQGTPEEAVEDRPSRVREDEAQDKDMTDEDVEPESAAPSPQKGKRKSSTTASRSSRSPRKAKTFMSARAAPAAKSRTTSEDMYPPGTLVWAKIVSFPFFPAEVIDPESDGPENPIPHVVLANREQHAKDNNAKDERTWLVRFFDSGASYGWIPESRIDKLGDDATDAKYLAGGSKGNSSKKGFKSSRMKNDCRSAYRRALAEDSDAAEEE